MERVVIIGGTGHVGTFLVPRLVNAGYEVVCVSRRKREPYQPDPVWQSVQWIIMDRVELEREGRFGQELLQLRPDIVIDMICFTAESARMIVEALQGRIGHLLHCGTMWVHGKSGKETTLESDARHPFGAYGINKAAIEAYLLEQAQVHRFPATVIHPGHIVGPGWIPVNPAGNLNIAVFRQLANGDELTLPNLGMETLHHVHADDVAQGFMRAVEQADAAKGQSFHIVSPSAITIRAYAEAMAKWFGREPKLSFAPWEQWKQQVPIADAAVTLDHLEHSANGSIEKARRLLKYEPQYSSLEAIQESLSWLMKNSW